MLGHPSVSLTKSTANKLQVQLVGDFSMCGDFAVGKAKQKALPKKALNKATNFCERLSFDLSWIDGVSLGGSKYWLLIVDEFSKFCWSFFLKAKSDLSAKIISFLKSLNKPHKAAVKYLRCDNAPENISFQK